MIPIGARWALASAAPGFCLPRNSFFGFLGSSSIIGGGGGGSLMMVDGGSGGARDREADDAGFLGPPRSGAVFVGLLSPRFCSPIDRTLPPPRLTASADAYSTVKFRPSSRWFFKFISAFVACSIVSKSTKANLSPTMNTSSQLLSKVSLVRILTLCTFPNLQTSPSALSGFPPLPMEFLVWACLLLVPRFHLLLRHRLDLFHSAFVSCLTMMKVWWRA